MNKLNYSFVFILIVLVALFTSSGLSTAQKMSDLERVGVSVFPQTPVDSISSVNATGSAGGNFSTTLGDYQTTSSGLIFNESLETKLNSTGNAPVDSAKGKIYLFVRDVITGYGVKSQIVFTSSKDSYLLSTNEGGILEFVAESGRFDLTINAPGHKQMKTFFNINPNEELKTNIWMDRESNSDVTEPENKSTAVIEGYVVDGASGKPIEGVNVHFTTIDKNTKTKKNGYFKIESEKASKIEGDKDDSQLRETIEFTKESFGDYAIKNFLLVKGVVTLKITLERGTDKVIENYVQGILDKQNENTDTLDLKQNGNTYINEQQESNQEQAYDNEKDGRILSPQSCPVLPTTIRVGTGCPSPVNCSVVCSGTVQVMSLESYVQSGLDNEWFSSWLPASLQAGAVAYRTYGAYYVINQPLQNPNYDIRSDTCNQVWGSATASSCINAANATVGEVIVNSSNVIVKSEYSAETNNTGCGNGFSGTGTTWPCISDNVCSGFASNGHGRGMCQNGSNRWATQGQVYTWILDHYYNPGNYFRCGSGGMPPANDNCSSAVLLTSNSSCNFTSGTVLNATASGLPKPSCDAFPNPNPNMFDVWYRFTAVATSQMVTVSPSTSNGDPVVSAYSSCSGSEIGCSDVGGTGVTENLSLSGLTVGNSYYIRIYDYGSIEPIGSDANFQICVTGTIVTPTITVSTTSLSNFGNVAVGQNSAPQSYNVSGSNLSSNISIQAPTGFQVSLSSTSGFTSALNLTQSGGSVPTTTIYARFSPQASGPQTGNISHTSSGATARNVSVSGTGTTSTIPVTVQTSPSGRSFTVDGTTFTSAQTFNWTSGENHTIATTAVQTVSAGTAYFFQVWSDGQSLSHIVSPTTATTFTANFGLFYQLTTNSSPSNGGIASPPTDSWYSTPQSVQISAVPNSGYIFSGWTGSGNGSYSGPNNAASISMNGPISQTANFSPVPIGRKPFDFDGDGRADVSVFRPTNGFWYFTNSSNGAFNYVNFGSNGDLIAPADFDGDGRADVSVFRPSNGYWYRLNSSNNLFVSVQFGQSGDIPVPGDFDGDGKADVSVFRPSTGTWYRLNSSNGQFVYVQFGTNGDKPQVGDFDGDGKTDLAVFRPSNGFWYILRSSDGAFVATGWGQSGDIATPADFDGDGKADISVFRPSNGTWYRLNSSSNQFAYVQFGTNGDIPAAADFDGDGKADPTVFRPSNGYWYSLDSTAGFTYQQFGMSGDAPTPAAFGR